MKLGIMQPYFFPYLGYFSLINYVDKWIAFDQVQYIYHGWINRNRILHPSGNAWQYINVPLIKHSRNTQINQIQIFNLSACKQRILSQLQHYKKKAPYFNETILLIEMCLTNDTTSLTELNVNILRKICSKIGISEKIEVYKELQIDAGPVNDPGDWALKISQKIGANEYVNPIGGIEIFDKNKFEDSGINLKFLNFKNPVYNQYNNEFIPGLSVIDVLMFNSIDNIKSMLYSFEFI
jgi:hypothetical protein